MLIELLKKSPKENVNLKQVYKATRDGDVNLHTFIDNKGPIVMVILANGKIFGGYTSLSWNQDGTFRTDKEAFLFSISDNYKLPINQGKNYWAIYAVVNSYTYMGYPSDLIIQKNFLNNTQNTAYNVDSTYPNRTPNQFLAGAKLFKIDELEAYTVKRYIVEKR